MKQPNYQPRDRQDWRNWLQAHHQQAQGVWLITFKKSSGKQVLNQNDAIEEALCFGWIDSQPSKLDDERTMLYFSPRKARSGWSKLNKERIQKMLAADQMQPAGLEKIAIAKQDGSWSKLDAVEALEIPPDLDTAFQRYPGSRENFQAFPPSTQRGILEWIIQAKRDTTRAKRIEETAQLASQNQRANQWPRPKAQS